MALIRFDNDEVWDNTLSGAARFTKKNPGFASTGRLQAYAQTGRFRSIEAAVAAATGVGAGKRLKLVTGVFDFDASYPTGGEDISVIDTDCFQGGGRVGIIFDQPNVAAVRLVAVAGTGAAFKLQGFTFPAGAPVEVAAATNLSAVTGLRFIAWGY